MEERDEIKRSCSKQDDHHKTLQNRCDSQQAELLRVLNRIHKVREDNIQVSNDTRDIERERGIVSTQQRNLALERHDVKKRSLILKKMKFQAQHVFEANQLLTRRDADLNATAMDIFEQSSKLAKHIEDRDRWRPGHRVLVFSMSQSKWHEGVIYKTKGENDRKLVIQYELDNGDINQKELDRHHKHVRPVSIDRSHILRSNSSSSLFSGSSTLPPGLCSHRPGSPTGSVRSMSSAGSVMSMKVGTLAEGFRLPPSFPMSPNGSVNGAVLDADWDTLSVSSVLSEDPELSKILDLDKITSLIQESTTAIQSFNSSYSLGGPPSTGPNAPSAPT